MPPSWAASLARFASRIDLYNFGRWLILALAIGVVAGLGATFLTWGVEAVASLVHHHWVGFVTPGHGLDASSEWQAPQRPWLLLLILPLVGLLVGWIVQTFAPEAEGHGTDAVIHAYHRERSVLHKRIIPVKLVASILTIGSGGSAGREGPVAHVGAGFASYLARVLRLPPFDRRILVISGMAAGVGGMFRAPLGAALFAIEVLYSENEYESEALIPAIMSSIIAYVVCASLTGWDVMFRTDISQFAKPAELISYLLLGIVLAFVGVVYVKVFYGMRDRFFAPLPVPTWTKPAIGGLMVACIALALPQVMGGGYGWLQLTLDGALPLKLLILLVPAKILATACTISSGGSGGVFAPSLVIGGMTGAVFAAAMEQLFPAIAPPMSACVLVGMGGFFAGVAKVPIASLIMVAEMSGSYSLLVPMMLVVSVSFLLTRGVSIYEAQVPGRIDSPAHLGEFQIDVLERLRVCDVVDPTESIVTVPSGTPFEEIVDLVGEAEQEYFPVVKKDGRVEGIFSVNDVRRVMATPEVWSLLVARDLGVDAKTMAYLEPSDDLHTAVRRFTASQLEVLPVMEKVPPSPVVGLLNHRSVMEAYDQEIHRLQAAQLDDDSLSMTTS
ncbi:MAG: chloride channel protein [bacterium]|nr:chloride channel protein [bacterium]